MTENNQANAVIAQTYNDLPYPSMVFSNTQPVRLHAIAKIKGLNPAPLENARVLEIGCSFGGNLLPFAIRYPQSRVVGIDLSERQIDIGRKMMQEVGVKNVELVAADISKVSFNIQFDYIICHGVFSWVPEFVQDAVLAAVRDHLAPDGIAYISYNTYPGWKNKDIAKELMQFGSNPALDPLSRLDQSLETLDFARNMLDRQNSHLAQALSEQIKELHQHSKSYLAHEYFEKFNIPMYFKEFVGKADQYGLAYLTDSAEPAILDSLIFQNDEYEKVCHFFNNRLEAVEQFIDFVKNRTFRCTLLTHRANFEALNITNDIRHNHLCHHFNDIYLSVKASFIEAEEEKKARWRLNNNLEFFSTPSNDGIFRFLNEQDEPCKIQAVLKHLEKLPGYDKGAAVNTLWHLVHLFQTYLCFEPEKNPSYGTKPNMFAPYRNLVRFIAHNPDITTLSNRYYQPAGIPNPLASYLAPLLDGTRTMKNLQQEVRKAAENDILVFNRNNLPIKPDELSDKELKAMIKNELDQFRQFGYFKHYG